MIFHIIALVYILVAGKPIVDEPYRVVHRLTFSSEDACNDYLKSPEFGKDRTDLAAIISSNVAQKLELGEAAPEHDDDATAAVPGVAITASCEVDNSL